MVLLLHGPMDNLHAAGAPPQNHETRVAEVGDAHVLALQDQGRAGRGAEARGPALRGDEGGLRAGRRHLGWHALGGGGAVGLQRLGRQRHELLSVRRRVRAVPGELHHGADSIRNADGAGVGEIRILALAARLVELRAGGPQLERPPLEHLRQARGGRAEETEPRGQVSVVQAREHLGRERLWRALLVVVLFTGCAACASCTRRA
mmetsp:Transcript_25517/g.76738  ORF Transcript_25517/g.76738 Transcript_25517/m.76738 type:complete len:205 (-) Transcript_25517:1520-2134(-)